MPTDKEFKKILKKKASENPEKYYAVNVLKEFGFQRKQCSCATFFWTVNKDQKVCGDPACSGGFRFTTTTPAKHRLDYIQLWQKFSDMFRSFGYTPIPRYPVVARWRDDTDFVQASIYDFQPYVVSGEVEPPANPLVVPQFCLRFNDIDNVGITGAHYTGFVMIGQHAFQPPEKYDQEQYFRDITRWLTEGLGLPKEEITFHEDAWAGGGNAGPCMEYFSRGLELGNQVYMFYSTASGDFEELKLKVLDMGMGHERNAWFTMAGSTSYDAVFPTVMQLLYKKANIKPDPEIISKFLPYSSYLNVDEVEDINETWKLVAKKVGIPVEKLRAAILPLAALYSIGEHSRSLLFALADGALPSNVGGGYNLRVILRRALGFIEKYKWDIDMIDLCKEHAMYLKPIFPELERSINNVAKILEVEKEKFLATRQKSKQIILSMIEKDITADDLLRMYDSQGISPDLVQDEAKKLGKEIKVPDNFYALAAELHEQKQKEIERRELLDLTNILPTEQLYYQHLHSTKAKVERVIDDKIILDRTIFYPTSGGQEHDLGSINESKVIEVYKQGSHIIHVIKNQKKFLPGETVTLEIEEPRRRQLMAHHTATHIINAAAKKVLGDHINQAGAKKTTEKAHIDLTHYQSLTKEEVQQIEDEANKIIQAHIPVIKHVLPRTIAEQKYSTRIYQGGAVPGKELRIIEIVGEDVEACGGTHCDNTKEGGKIKIIKSSKIQDGIVRLEFVAGKRFEDEVTKDQDALEELASLLKCDKDQTPGRAKELFEMWKDVVKKKKKLGSYDLTSIERYNGNLIEQAALFMKAQPEHIIKTTKRFLLEIEEKKP